MSAVRVLIPTALRRHTAGQDQVTCSARNLGELVDVLGSTFPELKPFLRDDSGKVRRFLNFYVNEEDIRFLGGDTHEFSDGDEVMVVPSIAGGCGGHN